MFARASETEGKPVPPSEPLQGLRAEAFKTREQAQKDLLAWARSQGEAAIPPLVALASTSDDPETKSRCFAILRDLAMDQFQSEGEGYIGISMLDVFVAVPGDPNPRAGIRIGQVVDGTAASAAGLRVGDVIVGMGDEVWREIPVTKKFGEEIRILKPKSKVKFKVLRDEKLLEIEVTLRRRPPIPNTLFLNDEAEELDLETLSKEEQESFFRNWLKAKKFKK